MSFCAYIINYLSVKKYFESEEEMEARTITNIWNRLYIIARALLIILVVACAGVFLINQALEYQYRSQFLQSPCGLCKSLNPNVSKCIVGCFTYKIPLDNSLTNENVNYTNLLKGAMPTP